jgi:hypothetical protein
MDGKERHDKEDIHRAFADKKRAPDNQKAAGAPYVWQIDRQHRNFF